MLLYSFPNWSQFELNAKIKDNTLTEFTLRLLFTNGRLNFRFSLNVYLQWALVRSCVFVDERERVFGGDNNKTK